MKTIIHVSAAILKDHKILLIRRKPDKKYFPNYWTCPGGKVEGSESLAETVKREVEEETGLQFQPTKPFQFYDLFHDDIHSVGHAFLGTYSGTIKTESDESVGFGWFSYAEAKELPLAHYVGLLIEDLHHEGMF